MNVYKESPESLRHILKQLRYEPDTGHVYWKQQVKRGFNYQQRVMGKPVGRLNPTGHLWLWTMGNNYPLHRIAFALHHKRWPMPGMVIDHINGIRDDNRIDNLREVTPEQNAANTPKQRALAADLK